MELSTKPQISTELAQRSEMKFMIVRNIVQCRYQSKPSVICSTLRFRISSTVGLSIKLLYSFSQHNVSYLPHPVSVPDFD